MRAAKFKSMKFAKSAAKGDDTKLAPPFTKKKKPESAGPVEGAPAKQRLDRPGRHMKKAGGGWTGEGDSERPDKEDRSGKAYALRSRAAEADDSANIKSLGLLGMGTGAGLAIAGKTRVGKLIGAGIGALGAKGYIGEAKDKARAAELREQANKVERGEDRRSGGRVK